MNLTKYINKRLFLPLLTISISLINFFFVVSVTNFFGPTRFLDLNFVIYGIVIFISGQLGTLLSNSYIPHIRQRRNKSSDKLYEVNFLIGFFIFTSILSILFIFVGLYLSSNLSLLVIFYGFFLFILLINQFISLRILEVKENYLYIQVINVSISLFSLIVFLRLSY